MVFCTCSQQLRFVEVDPEEDCRAKGDDENSPAKLQQCVARVASMCNFRDGQHCSGKRSCLGYPIFWHCLHLTSSSWSGDKCHVGKTKKCQAHSQHQKRRGATSHGECQTAKLQILPLNCSVLSQSCARCILLICSHGVSQALRGAHWELYGNRINLKKVLVKLRSLKSTNTPLAFFFWGYLPFTVIIAAFAESERTIPKTPKLRCLLKSHSYHVSDASAKGGTLALLCSCCIFFWSDLEGNLIFPEPNMQK